MTSNVLLPINPVIIKILEWVIEYDYQESNIKKDFRLKELLLINKEINKSELRRYFKQIIFTNPTSLEKGVSKKYIYGYKWYHPHKMYKTIWDKHSHKKAVRYIENNGGVLYKEKNGKRVNWLFVVDYEAIFFFSLIHHIKKYDEKSNEIIYFPEISVPQNSNFVLDVFVNRKPKSVVLFKNTENTDILTERVIISIKTSYQIMVFENGDYQQIKPIGKIIGNKAEYNIYRINGNMKYQVNSLNDSIIPIQFMTNTLYS